MSELADRISEAAAVPYDQIPHFPTTTVAGHEGKVLLGKLGAVPVIMFQGRFHYYEGHDLETVTFPVRVLSRLGVSTLILTAATGGIRAGCEFAERFDGWGCSVFIDIVIAGRDTTRIVSRRASGDSRQWSLRGDCASRFGSLGREHARLADGADSEILERSRAKSIFVVSGRCR